MKCIVCEKEHEKAGSKCKLCGMHSQKPIKYKGFCFCYRKCNKSFEEILAKSLPSEKEKMLSDKEALI